MLQEIHDTISRALRARSLDRRTCFASVRAEPPEGRKLVIECSDREVLDDIRRSLSEQTADRETEVEMVALPSSVQNLPELWIAAASVVDVRRDPAHAAELVTQLVYGDAVAPLKQEGDWALVRLDDGYVGWVRGWHLTGRSRRDHGAYHRAARHRVRDHMMVVYSEPSDLSAPVSDAVIGTPMIVEPSVVRGWRHVQLPDGRIGFMRARGIERRPSPGRAAGGGPALEELRRGLGATALRFLGVPYVWGGTTPKGFDCSGLTQRVYRLHGIVIPRDSDMQARDGRVERPNDVARLRIGELLFFGKSEEQITHVAISLSNGSFVHALGEVRVGSLVPSDPLFDHRLAEQWRLVGDPLSR